ncbi:MAG: 4-hydroxy-tetrahydrodipicolinate reductase [Bacteroidota bacterium]
MKANPRIALIGYGRMGQEIHGIITERGWPEPFIVDPEDKRFYESIDDLMGRGVDVCVEFTTPDQALKNILACVNAGLPVVSGTTGWEGNMAAVEEALKTSGGACMQANNFSLGIYLFDRITTFAASLLRDFGQYDIAVHEVHHTGKMDAPSGTALMLARSILDVNSKKTIIETTVQSKKADPEALYVTSSRVGSVFGDHSILIDSASDSIELMHRAKGRRGFAEGALLAAQWICDKQGMYTLKDLINDISQA